MSSAYQIESLLSARQYESPQLVGERLYFISDLAGRLSLYAMDRTGSVPEPLLPPQIALQNPHLIESESFFVFPKLNQVLVMIDHDGDENYQPMLVPLEGGIPEPAFGDRFAGQQVMCVKCDAERNLAVFRVDPRKDPNCPAYLVDLGRRTLTDLGSTMYGNICVGANPDYSKLILMDEYTVGDRVLYLWDRATGRRVLYGTPLEQRPEGHVEPLNTMQACFFTPGDRGLLLTTSLFDDCYGLGYLAFDSDGGAERAMTSTQDDVVRPVTISGTTHEGAGELVDLKHLTGQRYLLIYNIDGVSWAYEGAFDEAALAFTVDRVICGQRELAAGVLQHLDYDSTTDGYALAFSTATSPAQIYTLDGPERRVSAVTRQRILGIPRELLSAGEDASYTSHDGLRISARLYLPAAGLGFEGPRPVIFYVHGGPQGQERPDFTWFSMPLIQFFTLNGFAVFVPNVRGSTGYGLSYTKWVDRDWGGLDRLDHVAAFDLLRQDARLDMHRVGVMGRSYGGYMTLTLAGRHPDLWQAACDMFGPYNLVTFIERLPDAWQTYFFLALGHPERDRAFLDERSPSTYLHQLACPMLVIQGRHDPRVVEAESRDLVETLRGQGKDMELLVFPDEGHDIIKYDNKVRGYNAIVDFFKDKLNP